MGFADMIQLKHLKIQQVISKVIPDGVYLDVDGLAEIDLGNGTNYNAKKAGKNVKGKDFDHKDRKFKSVKANRGNDGKGTKREGKKKYRTSKS